MKNLLIFGVGLIGGSIALESQKKRMFDQVIGVQRDGCSAVSCLLSYGMRVIFSKYLNVLCIHAFFCVLSTPGSFCQN